MDASEIWDRWRAARMERPDTTPEEFAALFGARASDVLALIVTLRGLSQQRGLPPLVDVLPRLDGGPGQPFAGFFIEHGLGSGSTGLVFAARRAADGARVALKILNPVLAVSPERRDAVLREAEVAGRMEHPCIARLVASGVEHGYAWIATEWVDGDTLLALSAMDEGELTACVESMRAARAELIPESPREPAPSVRALPLAAQAAIEVGLQLASAIAHAHERGIVHRDLKPQNVLLARDGRVKVIDFGLASVEGTRLAVSSSGEWAGTPLYMAPEQLFGTGPAGPLTDLHALGLILADVATGSISSPERQAIESLDALGRSARAALKDALRRMPRGLREVVVRCTEHEPRHRYASAREVLEDLGQLVRGVPLAHGAANEAVRLVRAAARRRVRTLALLAGASVVTAAAWWVWNWSMTGTVRLATGREGEHVAIDGVRMGLTPLTVRLRAGWHAAAFSYDSEPFGAPVPFEVRARAFEARTFVMERTQGVEALPAPPGLDPARSAWLQIATPAPRMRLRIDEQDLGEVAGIVATRVGFGEHRVRIEVDGKRPIERVVPVRDGRLAFVSAEPDDLGSPWTTLVLYGPFDALVQNGLRGEHGLRVYCEMLPITWLDGQTVNKAYFGPLADHELGECIVALALPFEVGAIEMELGDPDIPVTANEAGAWHSLDCGPDGENWVPVYEVRRVANEPGRITWTLDYAERLARALAGRHELLLRLRLGGGSSGDRNARVCALRTNALPQRLPDGRLLWRPALRIRVRPRGP